MTRLSYVVVTDAWDTIRDLVACLELQAEVSEIELVAVAPASFQPDVTALGAVRTIPLEGSVTAGRAAAVRAAAGDVVALGETHVLPDRGWAGAVLAAHEAGADVVLPTMEIANPGLLSGAAFAMDYGRYTAPASASEAVPAYNASFRKEALLALEPLESSLVPGPEFDSMLRAAGTRVRCAPAARVAHLNVERPRHWLNERVLGGLLMASHRARRWSPARRVAYVVGSPAIAAVLFARAAGACRRTSGAAALPALALGCGLYAAGEAGGYAQLARERHEAAMNEYELHKRTYLRRRS